MMLRTMTILAALLVAACSGPTDKENNGWELNNDNPDMGADSGSDGGTADGGGTDGGPVDSGPDMPPTTSVEFQLINNSGEPVFAYNGTDTLCAGGVFLEVLEGGNSHPLQSNCTMCECGQDDGCAVCAIDCAPGSNIGDIQLGDGDMRSFTWDGLFRENQGSCYQPRPPQTDTLTARFCWGYEFETTFDDWGNIAGIECQDVEFDVGESLVQVIIEPTAREGVTFEMTNTTGAMLYASIGIDSPCIVDDWLIVEDSSGPLLMSLPCGECMCNEVNAHDTCPLPCPAACAAPTRELYEFPGGDTRRFDWNLTHYVRDEADGVMCLDDQRGGGALAATFCWAYDFDDESYSLVNETCETVTFDPIEQKQVRYEVVAF